MPAGIELDLDHEVATLTAQLSKELQGRVPGPVVEHAVEQARADIGDTRITAFVPILIERRVRAALGAHRRLS